MTLAVAAVCIVTAVAVLFLREHRPDFALLISAAAGVLLLLYILAPSLEIVSAIGLMLEEGGLGGIFKILLKVVGICFITDFAADLCSDFGQSSLATKVETAGKISVAVICLPLVEKILEIVGKLIG